METLDERLHSFDKPKSKASSSKSAWPHPTTFVANPQALAEAGFYFKPSKEDPDNVACFICKKELGGWDKNDNPFEVHVIKCPKCPWAVARCSLEFDVDTDGQFSLKDSERLPSNKMLEKARADTFGGKQKWWPHDSVKGHGATSKKMARAGFVYTPQAPGDDTATCFYCSLSLSGWDADDDPTEEHRKRDLRSGESCPFFQAEAKAKPQASQESGSKPAKKKGRPTKQREVSDDEDLLSEAVPPAPKPQSTGAKANKKKGRSTKQVDLPSDSDMPAEELVKEKTKPTDKKGKQKQPRATASSSTAASKLKKAAPILSDIEDSEDLREDDDPALKAPPAPAPRKSTRARSKPPSSKSSMAAKSRPRKAASGAEDGQDMEEGEIDTTSRPPSRASRAEGRRARGKSKETKTKPPSDVDARVIKEPLRDSEAPSEPEGTVRKKDTTTRARSRSKSTSRKSSKKPQPSKDEKPALLRAAERVRVSIIPEAEDEEVAGMEELEPTPVAKPLSKQAKSKKAAADINPEEVEASKSRRKATVKAVPVSKGQPEARKSESTVDDPPRSRKRETNERIVESQRDTSRSKEKNADADEDVHPVDERGHAADSNDLMDVDDDTHYETAYEERTPSPPPEFDLPPAVPALVSLDPSANFKAKSKSQSQSRAHAPLPTSPSDFKTGPSKVESTQAATAKTKKALKKAEMEAEAEGKEMTEQPLAAGAELRFRTPPRQVPDSEDEDKESDAQLPHQPTTPPPTSAPLPPLSPRPVSEPEPAAAFIPALAQAPLATTAALTAAERAMTVEQWIRHEMDRQAAALRADGEHRIAAFRMQAEEMRRRIEAL